MFQLGSKKKILLIEPPFYRLFKYERWHYPITLTFVGTYLEELGHEVVIYDADKPTPDCESLNRDGVRNNYQMYEKAINDLDHPIWHEVRETIKNIKPDVVGLTSITPKIDSANIIARITKELYGDEVKIMLGGPHVSGMLTTFSDYDFGPNYDYIVPYIPNLIDRKPNKNLLMNLEDYSPTNLSCLMTLSGCPNACTFCCHSFDEGKVTYRDISIIQGEINDIKEQFPGVDRVYLMDDCLLSNTKHFNAVTNIFKDAELKFTAGARIMALTPDKIDRFIESGGQRIYVGVESGSQRILNTINKRLSVEQIIKRTKWLNEKGIPWNAFIIVGFPFETLEDLKKTEELIYKIKPSFVSINRFTPYPGTEIYRDYYINEKIDFKDLYQLGHNLVVNLSDEMNDYIDYMFERFDEYNKNSEDNLDLI